MSNELKNKAIKGVIWSFIEQFSGQIIQFVISIILARILLPSDYGLIGMLAFFMAISQVFIDGGFGSALIQKKNRNENDLSTVFYINIGMSLACYIILFLCAPLISDFYSQPQLVPIIRIYSLTLVIGSISGINNTLLVINVDFKTKSKVSILSSVISGIIGIGFAYLGYGVWALIIQAISSSIISVILNFYFVRWYPKLIFSKVSFKALFSYGSKLLISSIIASAYTNIYSLVIGKQFSPAILGYYSRAQGFTTLVSNNINSIISRVSFPILSNIQDDDTILKNVYYKYIQMSSFVIFPCVLLLCGIAKPLVLILLTDKWTPVISLLHIICFSYLWNGIIDINLNLLKVKGRTDLVLRLEIIKKVIAVSILVISILFDNIYAICLGSVIYGFIALYLNTIYTKKLLNFSFLQQCKLFIPYLCIALTIMAISLWISNTVSNPYISIVTSLIICPVLYLFINKIFGLYAYSEFTGMIKPNIKYRSLNK